MKLGRVFLSGCAVYIIVAACSAIDPGRPGREAVVVAASGGESSSAAAVVGAGPGGGSGGRSGASAGGGIMDPVPTANADPTSGARLMAHFWSGADGSKSYMDGLWYDRMMDTDCGVTRASDGRYRCMPYWGLRGYYPLIAPAIIQNHYSDATCTIPISLAVQGAPSPRFATKMATQSDHERYYRIGAILYIESAYAISGASCVATPVPEGYDSYGVGVEVSPDEFVEMTFQVEP